MNAQELSTAVLAYTAAIVTVAPAVIAAYFKIKGMIEAQKQRIDQHDENAGIKTTPTPVNPPANPPTNPNQKP